MTTENIGEIVIAPRVLEVITGIAATKVDGVYALQNKNVTDSLSKTSVGRGVYLQTEEDGTVKCIRRAQRDTDYFATLDIDEDFQKYLQNRK